jgi:hypothetical protein
MVGLLELAHDRGCEADLADELGRILAASSLPDLASLQQRFAATDTAMPDVTVLLPAIAIYDALLSADMTTPNQEVAA